MAKKGFFQKVRDGLNTLRDELNKPVPGTGQPPSPQAKKVGDDLARRYGATKTPAGVVLRNLPIENKAVLARDISQVGPMVEAPPV